MTALATIRHTAAAVPEHLLPQHAVKDAVRDLLPFGADRQQAVLALFDAAGVARRYSVLPLEQLRRPRQLAETMTVYRDHAVRLGGRVATECLAGSGVAPAEVDLIITVSCTGFMIPSLDAHLVNTMGLRSDVRRLPITELGCVAGAAALAHAADFIAGHPEANVLVVSVELPTLSFQREDASAANLVSTALFGDGAAAALLTGRHVPGGATILAKQSHIYPDTIGALGFDLQDDGFHVVLARELPDLVRAGIGALVERLLEGAALPRAALSAFVLHPGGRRILQAIEQVLELRPDDTQVSRAVLRDYGNLSSASVLFVLHEFLTGQRPAPGAHGLLGAFGPGFSSELMVLRWN
jgi:alkylresorcinol/alkylpyrone synthase